MNRATFNEPAAILPSRTRDHLIQSQHLALSGGRTRDRVRFTPIRDGEINQIKTVGVCQFLARAAQQAPYTGCKWVIQSSLRRGQAAQAES